MAAASFLLHKHGAHIKPIFAFVLHYTHKNLPNDPREPQNDSCLAYWLLNTEVNAVWGCPHKNKTKHCFDI